jgi:hypothetical protein
MALDSPEDIVPKTRAEIEIAAGLIGIRSGTIRQWFHRRRIPPLAQLPHSTFRAAIHGDRLSRRHVGAALLGESRPEIYPLLMDRPAHTGEGRRDPQHVLAGALLRGRALG